ncbi:hypothetical protein DMA12_14905 [Amycolatopsis balhimycina DSM 5908]|uniref:Uncharacterized protein n=1 Tax=Amycolatopsis balhimycina DSM 5908 TaxID=1081091 RepID=A0A428WP51_AMYBA|nr:hypothetical protein [Amycolatopsis balhimycina]RSM44833.1 hypothetical protein DMA12_14905 [Amycolatopsis balhimycina DSM 5908]
MIDSIFRTVSGRASQRVFGAALLATAFLGAAVAAWSSHDGGALIARTTRWLTGRSGFEQGLATAAVLVGVTLVAVVVLAMTPQVLRWLQGYWPTWLDPVRARLVRRITSAADRDAGAMQELEREQRTDARLDRRLRQLPSESDRYLPTTLGNLVRAAQTRPIDKYGLDPVAIWPHLFLVMPEPTQKEITAAVNALERAVMAVFWCLLLVVLGPWVWWVAPLGIAAAVLLQRTVVHGAARTHAELIEAAVDLHRLDLYRKLRWPLPANPAEERELGEQLVSYLRYGSDSAKPTFTVAE